MVLCLYMGRTNTYLVLATNCRNGLSLLESLLIAVEPGEELWDVVGVVTPPIAPPISGPGGECIVIGFSPSELNFRNPPRKEN